MYACLHVPGCSWEQKAHLKECAQAFSPQIEETAPDCVLLDIRGLSRLFGKPAEIAAAIAERCRNVGVPANIAIASNPNAAAAAARGCSGITVIPFGEEPKVLGPLPIAILGPSEDVQAVLESWGVRTFKQFAALPERGIAERLGTEGLRLQKMARGFASRPLLPAVDPARFEGSIELEHPLELLEPLSFLLSRLLNGICAELETRGLATAQITIRLTLEDRTEFVRAIRVPFPSRDANSFLKLLQYDLSAHPPEAPIVGVWLQAEPVQPRSVQNGLFIPSAPEPERLELTLARIAAVVGEQNVGTPELLNTHRPGAVRMKKFVALEKMPVPADCRPHLAMRLFRPPLPATVVLSQGPAGSCHPERISAHGINGKITAWGGPWRSSGDWWTEQSWARDEWDVALQNGGLYRIYCVDEKSWFIEANYD